MSHPVGRAPHPERPPVEDVGIDHRGTNIGVAQQFLHGPDIVPVLQEMGGEGVTEMGECGNGKSREAGSGKREMGKGEGGIVPPEAVESRSARQ